MQSLGSDRIQARRTRKTVRLRRASACFTAPLPADTVTNREKGRLKFLYPIEAVQLRAIPKNRKAILADAIAVRLNDGECNRRCERRIDGIAAVLQHRDARLCRERLRRGDDVFRHHGHALGGVGKS